TSLHERLERLVIEGRGLHEVVASIAGAVAGSAVVQDATGREIARHPRRGELGPAALTALGEEVAERGASAAVAPFAPVQRALADRAMSVPVPGRRGGSPVAWLTVVSKRAPLRDFQRLIARQA